MRKLAIFNYLFIVIVVVVYLYYKYEYVPWFIYLLIVLLGFVYVWGFEKTMSRTVKQQQDKLLENDEFEFELETAILNKAVINHFRGRIADGGVGYLLQDKLVFMPHKLNLSHKKLSISFSEIETVVGYKIWDMFDTGLKIVLKSGRTEKFVIDKTSQFYKDLVNAIQSPAV